MKYITLNRKIRRLEYKLILRDFINNELSILRYCQYIVSDFKNIDDLVNNFNSCDIIFSYSAILRILIVFNISHSINTRQCLDLNGYYLEMNDLPIYDKITPVSLLNYARSQQEVTEDNYYELKKLAEGLFQGSLPLKRWNCLEKLKRIIYKFIKK